MQILIPAASILLAGALLAAIQAAINWDVKLNRSVSREPIETIIANSTSSSC